MTRSRTKKTPNQYTTIPFPLKALKLILKDVQTLKQGESSKTSAGMGAGADGGEVDVEEDDGVSAKTNTMPP